MKKLLPFFIIIHLIGCSGISDKDIEVVQIDCPTVFFSAENSVYVDGDVESIDLENINFVASLNNYAFVQNCFSNLNEKNYNLELLILADPMNPKNEIVNLPIFVLFYDKEEKLIDSQYFRIEGNLNYNQNSSEYTKTEIIKSLNIFLSAESQIDYLTIGFVKIN